jgi:hypothetical protein
MYFTFDQFGFPGHRSGEHSEEGQDHDHQARAGRHCLTGFILTG